MNEKGRQAGREEGRKERGKKRGREVRKKRYMRGESDGSSVCSWREISMEANALDDGWYQEDSDIFTPTEGESSSFTNNV